MTVQHHFRKQYGARSASGRDRRFFGTEQYRVFLSCWVRLRLPLRHVFGYSGIGRHLKVTLVTIVQMLENFLLIVWVLLILCLLLIPVIKIMAYRKSVYAAVGSRFGALGVVHGFVAHGWLYLSIATSSHQQHTTAYGYALSQHYGSQFRYWAILVGGMMIAVGLAQWRQASMERLWPFVCGSMVSAAFYGFALTEHSDSQLRYCALLVGGMVVLACLVPWRQVSMERLWQFLCGSVVSTVLLNLLPFVVVAFLLNITGLLDGHLRWFAWQRGIPLDAVTEIKRHLVNTQLGTSSYLYLLGWYGYAWLMLLAYYFCLVLRGKMDQEPQAA